MSRLLKPGLILLVIAALVFTNLSLVKAARGVPGSPEFGFGAILYPQGSSLDEALSMAQELDLDWLVIPVSWKDYQPAAPAERGLEPSAQLAALDRAMQFAEQVKIPVLLSLTGAPDWARVEAGPDAQKTAALVAWLVERYPAALQAIELFPGANTTAGWGSQPDPRAYMALFSQVSDQVKQMNAPVLLVAAGLRPLARELQNGDVDDLEYLQALYQRGGAGLIKVVSIQYAEITGNPLDFPDGSEHRLLRHYEEVRQVMAANDQKTGQIWITRFSPPSGTIKASDSVFRDVNQQVVWLAEANVQIRSQLYIGVSVTQSLNSVGRDAVAEVPCLLGADGYHPFYSVLRDMISLNKTGSVTILPGKPKGGNFTKRRP